MKKMKREMGPFQQDVVSPRTVDLIQDSNYRGCSNPLGQFENTPELDALVCKPITCFSPNAKEAGDENGWEKVVAEREMAEIPECASNRFSKLA